MHVLELNAGSEAGDDHAVLTVPPSAGPTVVRVRLVETRSGNRAKLGFDAARAVVIDRGSVHAAKAAGRAG